MSQINPHYLAFVPTTFKYSLIEAKDLCHCMHGILGEWLEFQDELLQLELFSSDDPDHEEAFLIHWKAAEKELGDMIYYTTMLSILMEHTPERIENPPENALETLADVFKKMMFYLLPNMRVGMLFALSAWWSKLCSIAEKVFNKDIEYFIIQNMEKLKLRYPSGTFTQEDAITKKDTKPKQRTLYENDRDRPEYTSNDFGDTVRNSPSDYQ